MGYSYKDKCSFISLHMLAFTMHLISSVLAFYLSPTDEKIRRPIEYQQYNYTTNNESMPITIVTDVEAMRWSSIFVIGVNEALAALSHLIGLLGVCAADSSKPNDKKNRDRFDYKGFSRSEEYKRRWFEYAVTAGLLEVGILLGQGEKSLLLLLFVAIGNAAMQTIGWFNDEQLSELRGIGSITKLFYSPTVNAFLILAAIIAVFVAHAVNQVGEDLKSLDFGYLALIFTLFYSSFGVHQLCYMSYKSYAKYIDIDRFYIVLGFTAKIVLSWTYISIERSARDELGMPYDDKVPWESSDDSIATWNILRVTLGVGALAVIGLAVFMEYNNVCLKMCGEEDSVSGKYSFKGNRLGMLNLYQDGPQEDDALLRKSRRRLNF
jgi:hypothetical protein